MMIGIDNGINGGLVGLDGNMIVLQEVMPSLKVHGKNCVDVRTLCEMLKPHRKDFFYVEYFQGGVQLTTKTVRSMEGSFQRITATLDLLGARWSPVMPPEWQRYFWSSGEDTKEASIKVAQESFPDHSFLATSRSKKPHHGLTDAALIALWGQRQIEAGKVPEEKKEAFEAEFVRAWNSYAIKGGLPKLQGRIPKTLRPAWGQRITDPEWRKNWEAALAYAITDDFYIGNTNQRWKLNPTTFLRPQCVPKLMLRRLAAKEVDDKLQQKEDQGTWL